MSVTIRDNKALFDKELKKALNGGVGVVVGLLGDSGAHEGGTSIVEVATYNEFGTRNIPERSFLRSTYEENKDEWISDLMQRYQSNKKMDGLGMRMKRDVQKKITELSAPPNSEATIRKKKSSNPLIDTGLMRQSINYKVRNLK